MKIPRDCNAPQLVRALRSLGYSTARQSGSHLVLTTMRNGEHHVTIPNHRPIKVGTLQDILKSIARHHQMDLETLVRTLEI